MRRYRPFRGVWIAWGRWWAVQFTAGAYFSLGVHIDPRRPILDLHLGWLIVALGRSAHITELQDRHRHTSRGFCRSDDGAIL